MEIIVGTAGHIDHGKTALVKALTGVDADRLPEEKQRGITIDLGFAECDLGDIRIGFVDVPGHERFVKNMLAGACGIDFVLLVVAADEGVMPQTREHFEICRLLDVDAGLIVLTKRDLVDDETLELARIDVTELTDGSFLADAPTIAVSIKTVDGIDELKNALVKAAGVVRTRDDLHVVRLPIDRSFTIKGFGTVVTGTLVSGEIRESDELELLPAGRKVRVRGLQTHGKKVTSVKIGQRTAVNLAGIDHTGIVRGMTLSESGVLRPTQVIDAQVEMLTNAPRGLRTRQRIRVHIGTMEALARVSVLNEAGEIAPGATDLAQLRFEVPVVALPNERFIIRSYSPQATIGGGCVIDALAEKHRKKDQAHVRKFLERLKASENDHSERLSIYIDAAGRSGLGLADLQSRTGLRSVVLHRIIDAKVRANAIVDVGDHFVSAPAFRELTTATIRAIESFHKAEPLSRGMPLQSLRDTIFAYLPIAIFKMVVSTLEKDGAVLAENDVVRLAAHRTELSPVQALATEKLASIYTKAGLEVPKFEDALNDVATGLNLTRQQIRSLFQLLIDAGKIVKVTDEFYFTKAAIDELTHKLREFAASTSDSMIEMAQFKALADISRKYAIPLLEYFDRTRTTRRAGDKRLIL